MGKTYNQVWVHAVWGTKYREPLIKRYFRSELNGFIKKQGTRWGIQIDMVNGMPDHMHALLKLPTTLSLAETMKLIKGASLKWVNDHHFPSRKFKWQEGYGVFSLNHDGLMAVRKYIYKQEQHHANISYEEEIKLLSKE
jgi:REP element-mobilizing transposase RayT